MKELRRFLRSLVASILGFDEQSVYWANQNAPKGAPPVAMLRLYSLKHETMAEDRGMNEDDKLLILLPRTAVLEVQIFDKNGDDPVSKLENLLMQLETPTFADRCHRAGVAFFDAEPVQDITGLLSDGKTYEPRAAVDLRLRYNRIATDASGIVEEIRLQEETRGRVLHLDDDVREGQEKPKAAIDTVTDEGDRTYTIKKGETL